MAGIVFVLVWNGSKIGFLNTAMIENSKRDNGIDQRIVKKQEKLLT